MNVLFLYISIVAHVNLILSTPIIFRFDAIVHEDIFGIFSVFSRFCCVFNLFYSFLKYRFRGSISHTKTNFNIDVECYAHTFSISQFTHFPFSFRFFFQFNYFRPSLVFRFDFRSCGSVFLVQVKCVWAIDVSFIDYHAMINGSFFFHVSLCMSVWPPENNCIRIN